MRAHARELDDGSTAADDREVVHRHVPGQHHVVGEHDIAADAAVVTDVAVGQERAAVADNGGHAAALGAGVHGDAFADQAVGADGEGGWLALVLQVLRLMADRGKRENARSGSDRRAAGNNCVADQLDSVAKGYHGADLAEGADAHAVAQPSAALDDCRSVHLRSVTSA